jgi:hypothetical protein
MNRPRKITDAMGHEWTIVTSVEHDRQRYQTMRAKLTRISFRHGSEHREALAWISDLDELKESELRALLWGAQNAVSSQLPWNAFRYSVLTPRIPLAYGN